MRTLDVSGFMEEAETPKTRAYSHALDLEYLFLDEMEKKNISKKELAEKMGIQPSRLSKLLNGQPNMTLETIAGFELALGFDIRFEVISTEEISEDVFDVTDERPDIDEHEDLSEEEFASTTMYSFEEIASANAQDSRNEDSRPDLEVAA